MGGKWPKQGALGSTPNLKSSLEPAGITSDQTSGPSSWYSRCQATKELDWLAYRLQKGESTEASHHPHPCPGSPTLLTSHSSDHFDHIRAVTGCKFIGIGGDYDGAGR